MTFQREFTALHSAHKAGLHAEAALQLALKQLSGDECGWLKSLLDTPDDPGPDTVAASLTLSMTEQNGDKSTVTAQDLNGAFIVTRAMRSLDADSPHSVLLYWPGTGGGLQRFANRRELERQVFKIHDRDNGLSAAAEKNHRRRTPVRFEATDQRLRRTGRRNSPASRRSRPTPRSVPNNWTSCVKRALATLQVPVHAARSLAFAHLLEQDRSATLASSLPTGSVKLSAV